MRFEIRGLGCIGGSLDGMPEKLAGYVVESELGRGGMGVVYLARDPRLDRLVAIKCLPEEMSEHADRLNRFEREAKTIAALNHPNVAIVYGLHEHLGQQLLVMEYVPGEHLGQRLRARGLSVAESLAICAQVAAGIEAAHEMGVIHRDVKPANVRVRPDGAVKVLDFGLAKPETEAEPSYGMDEETMSLAPTEAGRVLGTAGYMAPEQARGKRVDKRADIWAFGAVLFECLAGERAFPGETAMDAIVAILEKEPPWHALPAEVPTGVVALLRKCLEKDEKRRLRDIGDARLELENALESRDLARTARDVVADTRGADGARAGSRRSGSSSRGSALGGMASLGGTGAAGRLPADLTKFIGRERELAEVTGAVERSRLVTLAGSGGSGKTRLATEVGRRRVAGTPDGVWFVDFGSIDDGSLVAIEVAQTLGLTESPGDAESRIIEAIGGSAPLLILDTCEHVVDAARGLISALLSACPNVRVLATCREPVGVPGETLYRVPTLAVPGAEDAEDPEKLLACESVKLFVDRAKTVKPGFEVSAANALEVAELCRKLDGIPLAIELAAARVKLLSVKQISERLEDRFRLLRSKGGTGSERQQTLLAAIDWSYDQLDDSERATLRRLSVFRGGMTLDLAERVCGGGDEEMVVEEWEVLDSLAQLVDKSLVVVEDGSDGEGRYQMLETIRAYAAAKLEDAGETAGARDRHLLAMAEVAEGAEAGLLGGEQKAWFDRLEQEHDNFRAALEWVLEGAGDLETGRRLAAGIWRFWAYRGFMTEGREYLMRLDHAGAGGGPTAAWAKLREAVSWMAMLVGDLPTAVMFGRAGLDIARASSDELAIGNLLNCLGAACHGDGLADRAVDYFQESLAIRRKLGDELLIAATLNNLGECRRQLGDLDAARGLYKESLEILDPRGTVMLRALALSNLAWCEIAAGDDGAAEAALSLATKIKVDLDARGELPGCFEAWAALAVMRGDLERGVRLFGAAAGLRERLRMPARPSAEMDFEPWLAKAKAGLDIAAFDAAWAEGSAMKARRAARYAVSEGASG